MGKPAIHAVETKSDTQAAADRLTFIRNAVDAAATAIDFAIAVRSEGEASFEGLFSVEHVARTLNRTAAAALADAYEHLDGIEAFIAEGRA